MLGEERQDSAARTRVGVYGPFHPLSAIYETADWAERHDMYSYWLGDRAVAFPEPHVLEAWSMLAALAVRTSRLRLGMAVTDPFRRTPALLAQTVTALDHLSDGRVLPGIGMGEKVNVVSFGIPMKKRSGRLEEFVRLMKLYWTGEPVDFAGEYFSSDGGRLLPGPVQAPHPPVWMAGNARATLDVVGRVADAWLPAALTPSMYEEDLTRLRAEAIRAGRGSDAVEPGLFMYTVLHDDAEHARRTALELGRGVAVWWRGSLRRLGSSVGSDDLTVSNFDGTPEATQKWQTLAQEVQDEALEQLITFGNPEQVADRMEQFVAAGVKHFVVISLDGLADVARWKETVKSLHDDVLPILALRGAGSVSA